MSGQPTKTHRLWWFLGVAVVLTALTVAACLHARPPVSPLSTVIPRDNYLVWLGNAGHYRTVWLEIDRGQLAASHPAEGLVLFGGGYLWSAVEKKVPVPLVDCPDDIEDRGVDYEQPPSGERGTERHWEFQQLGGDRVDPFAQTLDETAYWTDFEEYLDLEAIVGRYVFVSETVHAMGCGAAHGINGVNYEIWDLAAGRQVKLTDFFPEAARNEADDAAALAAAKKRTGYIEDSNVWVVAIRPTYRWQPAGQLKLDLLYAFNSSDPSQSDFDTVGPQLGAVQVETDNVPAQFEPYRQAPPAVTAFIRQQPAGELLGWTPVTGTPDQLVRMLGRFRSIQQPEQ